MIQDDERSDKPYSWWFILGIVFWMVVCAGLAAYSTNFLPWWTR